MTLRRVKYVGILALLALFFCFCFAGQAYADQAEDASGQYPNEAVLSGEVVQVPNEEAEAGETEKAEADDDAASLGDSEGLGQREIPAAMPLSDDETEEQGFGDNGLPSSTDSGFGGIVELKADSVESEEAPTLLEGVYVIASEIDGSAHMEVGNASQSNGAGVNVYTDNWTPAQRWYITSLEGGYYKIMNVSSGKYLDVAGAKVGDGARVQQYEWNGTKAQQWHIAVSDSGYMLYSALSTTYVLDLKGASTKNGTTIQLYHSNDTKAQRWSLTKIEPVLSNGLYTASAKSSGKKLDVSGGSVYAGANVQQYQSNGTMPQSFYLSYNSKNGYYTVLGSNTGLALDVSGGSNSSGANVQMYTPNNTKAQWWAIAKNSDGTYTLHSAISGHAIDVSGASKSDGANVQVYASNNSNAQRWTFSSVQSWSIPEGVYNIVTGVNQYNSLMVANSSRANGANVLTASTSNTSWGQKWVLAIASDGYYTIRNLNSRMLLEVADSPAQSGSNARQQTDKATSAQLWKPELTAGGIVFKSKANNSIVLDISGASTRVGANVQVYASNGTAAQKFRVSSVDAIDSGTTFVFKNLGLDDGVLDVVDASKANGAPVQLYVSNGTGAQKFKVISNGGGMYYLQNINSLKYLDVDKNTKTIIQQWEGQSGSNKQWELALDLDTGSFTVKSVYTGTYLDGSSGTLSLKPESSADAQKFALQPITFKVFLDAGHIVGQSGYDSGAVGNGYTEAQLTSDLTSRIYKICVEEYGLDVVDGKTYGISYEKRTGKAVELGCTALVSIHFNAGGGSGYMTIVGSSERRNENSYELASLMHAYLGQGMSGLNNYGISTRGDLAIPNDSRIAATLLEVAFIDNSYDMSVYNSRRDAVARSLAQGIYEASMRGSFNG